MASRPGDEILRISALGLYRAFINGVRVGNDLLTPGWTSYDKRLSFQTYEVGPLLRQGQQRHRHLARRRLVPVADDVEEKPDLQHLGKRDRRDRRTAARCRSPGGGSARDRRQLDERRAADQKVRASISARSTMRGWKRSMPTAAARSIAFDTGLLVPHEIDAGPRARATSLPSSPGEMPRTGFSTISARTLPAMSPSP